MGAIKINNWGADAGAELCGLRHKRRLKQSDIAKRMSITQQTVSNREADARLMTFEEAVMLCGILGCQFEINAKGVVVK